MADLVILPANVREGADPQNKFERGKAGEVIDAGEVVYFEKSTSLYKLASNDTAEKAAVRGFASNSAELNQPIRIQSRGELSVGSGVQATAYFLSGTPGKVIPEAEVLAADFKTLCSIAKLSNRMQVQPVISGTQVP